MHQNGSNGHTSSSGGESNARGSLEKQMVSLDFTYHMPHFLTTATTTAATTTSVGGGNSSTAVSGVAAASASAAAGHGHSHSHSEHHNHHHPSVIHEGHSEGKIAAHLSPDHSQGTSSNASLHLDARSGCVDQQSSVVIKAESVDLSTSGNNINNSTVTSQQISNANIKMEKESSMHSTSEERHENKATTGTDGKDCTSRVDSAASLSDSIQSDSSDNRCQSSSTSETKSPLDSSAVTPPSS